MRGHWQNDENGSIVFVPSGEVPNQQVGIFWFIDDHVIKDAVPYEAGEPYGEAIQHGGHYEFWDALQPATELEQKLKSRAYDAYPRGRIVFFPERRVFRVYPDRCLNTDEIGLVLEAFDVEDFDIEVVDDEHYRCAQCNPDYME